MSVSITLIPVVLALRVVMGKKRFESWVASTEVLKETHFENSQELITTVKICGYPVEKIGVNLFKTEYSHKNYVLWSYRFGKWVGVFSKYANEELIQKFITDLEHKAQRSIFKEQSKMTDQIFQTYPTNFNDLKLLKEVLNSYGVEFQEEAMKLQCHLGNEKIIFTQLNENSIITVMVPSSHNIQAVHRQLVEIDEDYKSQLQERTYQNVIKKAEQQGFVIEQEEVLEDNSIVITLNVQK